MSRRVLEGKHSFAVPHFLAPSLAFAWAILALVVLLRNASHYFLAMFIPIIDVGTKWSAVSVHDLVTHWAAVALQGLAAILFLGVCWSVGRLGLQWVKAHLAISTLEFIVLEVLGGLALCATLVLGLGLCGLLFPMLVFCVAALCGMAALLSTKIRFRSFAPFPSLGKDEWLLVIFLAVALAFLIPFGLAPMTGTDILAYGISAPYYFIYLHKIPYCLRYHFQFPSLEELSFCSFWHIVTPATINLLVVALMVLLVFGWVSRRWGRAVALLAVCGLMVSTQTGFVISRTKNDLLAATFAILAVMIWDSTRQSRHRHAAHLLWGSALGWAFCTKYPAAAIGAGLIVWQFVRGRYRQRNKATSVVFGLIGFFVATSPFLFKNWLMTGNPIYPFFFGGLGWTEASDLAFRLQTFAEGNLSWRQPLRFARAFGTLFTEYAPIAGVGLPLVVLSRRKCVRDLLPLSIAAVGGIFALIFLVPVLRYTMIPSAFLFTILGAIAIVRSPLWNGRSKPYGVVITLAILTLGLIQAIATADFQGQNGRKLAAGLGLERAEAFLERTLTTYWQAAERLTYHPPARLLLVGESKGALFAKSCLTINQDPVDFPLILTMVHESHTAEHIAKRFKQLGVTQVVLNYVSSVFWGATHSAAFVWKEEEIKRYYEFWTRWAEWIKPQDRYDFANGGFAFYELRKLPARSVQSIPFLPGTEGLATRWFQEDQTSQLQRLEQLVSSIPGVGHFETSYGCVLVKAGQYQKAITYIRRGLECGFLDAGPYGCLGLALRGLGGYSEAASAFHRAAELQPENPAFARLREECERAARRL